MREINSSLVLVLGLFAFAAAVVRADGPQRATSALSPDPAWTPRPGVGNVAAWQKETDKDWIDGRFREMDTGPFLNATVDYPSWRGDVRSFKATAIRVGDEGRGAVLFDRNQLRLAAGWTGGFLKHSDRRFGLLNTPTPAGAVHFATGRGPGWTDPSDRWDDSHPSTAPLPREWAGYRGLYLHGDRIVLSYTVGSAEVLESPWMETAGEAEAFTRTVEVGGASHPMRMLVCDLPGGGGRTLDADGVVVAASQTDGNWTAVALIGDRDQAKLQVRSPSRVEVALAPRGDLLRFKILIWRGQAADLSPFLKLVEASPPPQPLSGWTQPGPPRWTKPIHTRGVVAANDAPYVIDTLSVPYDNPHQALMFLSGVDFLPCGDIAVCTVHGDVWLVQGVDDRLKKLTWKRFATGLYQPLGLKVVEGVIHVLERGQLTRLHDRDGDGEADFYENFNHDWHTGGGEHAYDVGLETDPQGNFYFFKTGDTATATGGCLLRVSADGRRVEIFATGFRHPIGLSVSPDGIVTGADQEGNWMPATRIDQYRRGGFYGDMRAHHRSTPPVGYDGPLCWLPHEVDNSAGGQIWAPSDRFGPLSGQLLHLSYGRCKLMLLMRQEADGQVQGGAADLGLQFLSGAMRGRFHPRDGHLYVSGLRGWQTAAVRDGCLQRVRYTGQEGALPIGLSVHENGVRLTFTQPLDRQAAETLERYRVEQWNYRWSGQYGSRRWSVADPDKEGQDPVPLASASLLPDGQSVFLEARGLAPVMQMQISYRLLTAAGEPLEGVVYNTIHFLCPADPAVR